MACLITTDDKNKIVKIRIYGQVSHEEHMAGRKKAYKVCAEKGYTRLLADLSDLNTDVTNTTFTCYDFGKSYQQDNPFPKIKISTVLPKDPKTCTQVHFTVTVGVNRGIDIGEFENLDEAEKWLIS